MGQHSRLTMVGFFMELTYHELSDRTWDENPRASGHQLPTGREQVYRGPGIIVPSDWEQ